MFNVGDWVHSKDNFHFYQDDSMLLVGNTDALEIVSYPTERSPLPGISMFAKVRCFNVYNTHMNLPVRVPSPVDFEIDVGELVAYSREEMLTSSNEVAREIAGKLANDSV